jgi:hypothetical protein
MSNVTCPHYTSHITGAIGVCRGCGCVVVNPASVVAQQTGLLSASGKTTVLSLPGSTYATVNRTDPHTTAKDR